MQKIKSYIISIAITFAINIILLIIFSAILTYTNISDTLLQPFVFASIIISSLIRWI